MRDSRDRTVPSDAVRAIGRFNTDPTTYRAREPYVVDAPVRASRKEAMADIPHDCPWSQRCLCDRDGSLCVCTHQNGDHNGACDLCGCQKFETYDRHGSVPSLFDLHDLEAT